MYCLRPFLALVFASLLATPEAVVAADKIHLRIRAGTLDDGVNVIHTFPTAGRLMARASGSRILGYDAELTIYDPETGERRLLPLKRIETREGLEDPPPGANEPRCIEWRERCYAHDVINTGVCDTVCTKIYDPATKEVLPVTKPETIYVTLTKEYGKFKRKAHEPKKMQRKRPALDD